MKPIIQPLLIIILTVAVVLLSFRSCNHTEFDAIKPLTDTIKTQKQAMEVKLKQVDTIYVQVLKYRDRWHEVRKVDTIPCEEKLVICDTIILTDSTLIEKQREVIKLDSSIISNQDLVIAEFPKRLKKERKKGFWRGFKWGFVFGNVTGASAASFVR